MGNWPFVEWPYALIEWSVYAFFAILAWNAWKQGRAWFFTLVCGFAFGLYAEHRIINDAQVQITECLANCARTAGCALATCERTHYVYPEGHFLMLLGVPLWVGLGWGFIIYAASWTAHRLKIGPLATATAAAYLAVSVDLSLEPIAHHQKFWEWCHVGDVSYYGVSYNNFLGWIAIVGLYTLCTRWALKKANARLYGEDTVKIEGKAQRPWWVDALVPALASVFAFSLFWFIVRKVPDLVATMRGKSGTTSTADLWVFTFLFIVAGIVLWANVFKVRRNHAVNRPILAMVVFYHLYSLAVLLLRGLHEHSALAVAILMNLVVSFFAYSWPFIDTLLAKENGTPPSFGRVVHRLCRGEVRAPESAGAVQSAESPSVA